MNETSAQIFDLSKRISQQETTDPHLSAVLAPVAFVNEIFSGIGTVCDIGNGLAGETLLRTLFEAIPSAVILAKHPDKHRDFIAHGRMTELRMLRVIEVPALKTRLESRIKATEAEFQDLWEKFNENRWHGLSPSFDVS